MTHLIIRNQGAKDNDDPHYDLLNETTKYGFIFSGVHFERVCVDRKGKITVYISSKRDKKYIHVTKGGRITMEDAK